MNKLEELKLAANFTKLHDRILNNSRIQPSGCIEYQRTKDTCGYSSISVYIKGVQRKVSGHRLIYILKIGDIPENGVVMHSCDNPSCVNSKHLTTGSVKDNVSDCIKKDRFSFTGGRKNSTRKQAIQDNEMYYIGSMHKCGNKIRYTNNGACVSCAKDYHKKKGSTF